MILRAPQKRMHRSPDPLFRAIVATAAVLGASHLVLFLCVGTGMVFPEIPGYNPITSTFAALATISVAFLALGRYKVLRDPTSYWSGAGFASVSVGLLFYVLAWPGLLPGGRSIIGHLTNTTFWLGRPAPTILGVFLIAAVTVPWPKGRALGGRCWLYLLASWLMLLTLGEILLVVFERDLPVLIRPDGSFTALNVAMQLGLAAVFTVGAVLSTWRYRRSGDALPGYIALCQITYAFTEVTLSVGAKRYDIWWYTNRLLLVSGFLAVMFGLLSEYVGLFRRERDKTNELQAKSAELQAALQALSIDMAERRRGEEEIRQLHREVEQRNAELEAERARWQGVVEGIADEVWVADAEGKMSLINLPAITAMGLDAFKDRSIDEVLAEVDILNPDGELRPAEDAPLFRSLRGEIVRGEEIMRHRTTGKTRYRQFSSAPTRDASGQITGAVAIVRDITASKQAEAALIRSEKLAATGRLAATIAHEINNPLEAMTNVVYLLSRLVTERAAREYVEMIDKQLQTVTRIANQTLKFHRENGRPVEFTLAELIRELLEFYEPKAMQHGVIITKRLEAEARLIGFSGEVRQVISNLLLNAMEATPSGGSITVHLHEGRDWRKPGVRGYRCTIVDSGSGIDPEHRPRIFEPFFTTKGEKGTGLGLWVSMGIVQRAGGSMRVWSTQRPGRSGTCFSIFLPAAAVPAIPPARRRYEANEDATGVAV